MSTDHAKLEKPTVDVYSGVRWSAFSKYGAQGMQFIIALVMARLLAPEYFGLLGMATVVTGFVQVFRNLGFSSAIVQRKEVSDALLSTLFWVNLAVCLVVGLIVLGIAPVASWIYDDPRVTPIIAVLSVNFVFAGFTMIPSALLTRRMEFKTLAIREIGGVFASGATGLTLAFLGWGVWALVGSSLASSATQMILINLAVRFYPRFVIDKTGLSECFRFGINLTGFNFFNYFARNADNLIIGVFLGPIALGYYSLAYKLMLLPRDSITRVVTRVLFPKLSKLQNNDARLSAVFIKACGAIAFVTFPMMFGLAVVADLFVVVVLGEKWLPAVPVILALAPLGAIQSIWTPIGQLYLAKGNASGYLRFGIATGIIFTTSFLLGVPFGVVGVATSYCIASLIWTFASYSFACRQVDGVSVRAIWSEVFPIAADASAMACTVFVLKMFLQNSSLSNATQLSICVLVGMTATIAISLARQPRALTAALTVIPIPGLTNILNSRT